MAIDNENLEMVELLIHYNVDTKDALLHAISEEFVEAVEMLLDHEDGNRNKEGHHVSFDQKEIFCWNFVSVDVLLLGHKWYVIIVFCREIQITFAIVMQISYSIRILFIYTQNDIV